MEDIQLKFHQDGLQAVNLFIRTYGSKYVRYVSSITILRQSCYLSFRWNILPIEVIYLVITHDRNKARYSGVAMKFENISLFFFFPASGDLYNFNCYIICIINSTVIYMQSTVGKLLHVLKNALKGSFLRVCYKNVVVCKCYENIKLR